MKQPNQRYGNPAEFAYYIQGRKIKDIARELRRTERSVRDWLNGRKKVPWWVPEVMRLRSLERDVRMQQMGIKRIAPKLSMVSATVAEWRPPAPIPRPAAPIELLPQNVA